MNDAYKQAGVDIEAGYEAVNRIKKVVQKTHRPEVLSGIGGFGALFQLDISKYKQPVLVSGTDGVGTKLKLAFDLNTHHTIGIDAVAMCVNDIAVQGAEPLFFLDYVACGKLEPEQIEAIVTGIADGCVQAGCALIGGETAEMPGFYPQGEYDVAGFCVGAVDKDQLIDGSQVKAGDVIIGVGSSGVHSNGFSLVRKLLGDHNISLKQPFAEQFTAYQGTETVGEVLLTPTKIYVRAIQALIQKHSVKSMGHITGGGFFENIPRALPEGLAAEITLNSWDIPMVFQWLQQLGSLKPTELFSTFNMGIGLVVVLAEEEAEAALETLKEAGEQASIIGKVTAGNNTVTLLDERNAPCQL